MRTSILPRGWVEQPLEDFAVIERDIIAPECIETGTKYVGLEHITGEGSLEAAQTVKSGQLASAKFRFGPDHILYGKLRPYLRKIARPSFDGICSTDIVPLKPRSGKANKNYLFHYLRTDKMIELATSRSAGANLPRLSPRLLAGFPVVAPRCVDEQKRIAAILDKADAIRRKRRQALADIDVLLRATFLDMFGDPRSASDANMFEDLGDVCDFYAGSTLPEAEEFDEQSGGALVIKVAELNMPENQSVVTVARGWAPLGDKREGILAPTGGIVFPKRGGAIATNRKRVLGRPAYLDPNLMAVAPKPDRYLSSNYLRTWFELFDLESISSGSAVPQLNKRDLAPLKIHVPSVGEVKRFDFVTDAIGRVRKRAVLGLEDAASLFGSLSQRAFRGEL